jgi:ribonuclease P protein component
MTDTPSRLIFGRSSRILNAKDFSAVMRARMRFGSGLFVGHVKPRAHTNQWRLGLVLPKKFEPSAVRRNALKRVWRDLFRRELPALEQLPFGHDLVVRLVARPKARALTPLRRTCRQDACVLLTQIRATLG